MKIPQTQFVILFLAIISTSQISNAQDRAMESMEYLTYNEPIAVLSDKIKKDRLKDDDAFDNLKFHESIERITKKIKKGKAINDDYIKIAESYYQNGDYKHAVKYFNKVENYRSGLSNELKHHYAHSLKYLKKYKEADQIMMNLSSEYASLYLKNRNYLKNIESTSGKYQVISMPFNTEFSEFTSGTIGDRLIFASSRKDYLKSDVKHSWTGESFLDLYHASISENNEVNIEHLDKDINSKYHESSAVYTKNGLTMYFTRNNTKRKSLRTDRDGFNRLTLLKAERNSIEEPWSNIEELPFNSIEFSVAHPALSPDDKTLFFVSDMPGSLGQSDIFKVNVLENGYSNPENLVDVNTVGRETFPHICPDGKLFFSSDGHQGLGGLDIFKYEDSTIINMGSPINSSSDDFGFVQNADGNTGYLSSNREGGKGKDDIYTFAKIIETETIFRDINVTIIDQINKDKIIGANVTYENTNGKNESFTTDKNGQTVLNIEKVNSIYLNVDKESYLNKGNDYQWNDKVENTEIVIELLPHSIKQINGEYILNVDPVFYDLDKALLRSESKDVLNELVSLMKTYPELKVEIQSHTDSRASSVYNQELSKKRSTSVLNFLLKNSINENRFTTNNFGENRLSNQCDDSQECLEKQHQNNRRTEFVLINL